MTDFDAGNDVRALLHGRAIGVEVPEPPLGLMLERGSRTERRRNFVVLGAVAATVVAVISIGFAIAHGPDANTAPTPSKDPTSDAPSIIPTPGGEIRSLEDLKDGRSATTPIVVGRTVRVGDKTYALNAVPDRVAMLTAKGTRVVNRVIVQNPDGSIDALHLPDGDLVTVAESTDGPFVASHGDGDQKVLYLKPGTSTADDVPIPATPTVFVHDLVDGSEIQQEFPVSPSCCDNPFELVGVDNDHHVVAGTASDGFFVWNYGAGQIKPTDIRQIEGFSPGAATRPLTVTDAELIADGPGGFQLGDLADDGTFTLASVQYDDSLGDVADFTLGDYALYADGDGHLHAATRSRNKTTEVELGLPPLGGFPALIHREDQRHVVFDIPAAVSGETRDAQVRCNLTNGDCEIAGWFSTNAASDDRRR